MMSCLAPEDQDRLRQDACELLYLLAEGESRRGERSATRGADATPLAWNEEDDELHRALRFNSLAESCYPADASSRVLWMQRARLASFLGNTSEAERLSAKGRTIPLRGPRDYYLMGLDHAQQGRYREALAYLETASGQDPQHYWASFIQGWCHANLEELPEALACYRATVALWPSFHGAYLNRGLVYYRQKDYERACADFDRALSLRPDSTEAHGHRAAAREAMNRWRAGSPGRPDSRRASLQSLIPEGR
jgi:tetratricopeptide (TPR) repeat protein